MKKVTYQYIGAALITATIVYSIIQRGIKKKEIGKIHDILDKDVGAAGGFDDLKRTALNPSYYTNIISQGIKPRALKASELKAYGKQIKDAWGIFDDDENAVYGAFRGMASKFQVSQVASFYGKAYKEGLFDKIKSKMGPSEQETVYKIISVKPDY